MMYQCGRCGLKRASAQDPIGSVLPQCRCSWEFTPPVMQQQQRTWVGLTDEEIEMIVENKRAAHWEFIRQVEAKLKAKNERLEKNT